MTRLDALTSLRDAWRIGLWMPELLPNVPDLHTDLTWKAFEGSLNDAKALHEAVLPGWTLDQFGQRAGGWVATLGCRDGKTPRPAPSAMVRGSPARAWLLAILEALIAQEEAKT